MLTFNLKKQWYEKIRSGEKTIEYREVKPYWTKRLNNELTGRVDGVFLTPFNSHFMVAVVDCSKCPLDCILRLGYTKQHLLADIVKIEIVDGKDTDLAIDAPVYAIHFADVREVNIRGGGGNRMNYFEKAVEDYAKEKKEYYDFKMKHDILRFNQAVEKMTADGKCPENSQILFLNCRYCPVFLARETNDDLFFRCDEISPQRRREIMAMELKMTSEEWDEFWSVEKSQNVSS